MGQNTDEQSGEKDRNKIYKYCLRCGRRLISEESKRTGMGKICLNKSLTSVKNHNHLF